MRSRAKDLEEYIRKHKPYLEPRLTIDGLANRLSVKKHILSQVLNDYLGISFYDYINNHRVQEFKARLKKGENAHLSLLGLALECGFNSKSSFNQVFKKFENKTPSEYYKNLP